MANALPITNQGKAQLFYVAYYGRPADPAGLNYWTNVIAAVGGDLSAVTRQFGISAEAQEIYGGKTSVEAVASLYKQLFGRDAESAGLLYWADLIDRGQLQLSDLPLALYGGALGSDLTTINNKLALANAFTAALDTAPEIIAYVGVGAMSSARDLLATVTDSASLTAALGQVDAVIDLLVNPVDPNATYTLLATQDNVTTGSGNDTFLATDNTLQLGDRLNGGAGNDTLNISIAGPKGALLKGFATTGIENIVVKSLATTATTLDLSDTLGVVSLESMEVDGATLTFEDIQSVNATSIRIIDTDEDHYFIYDTNAYAPSNGLDTVDLTLQEIRGEGYTESGEPVITFSDKDDTRSDIEVMNLHSLKRPDAGPTPATANYVGDLNVGAKFDTLNITGGAGANDDADLEIEASLDEKLRVINASQLRANLTLDVVTDSSVRLFVYDGAVTDETGARGVDNLDVTRNGNNDIDLASGNDDLHVVGHGNQTIVAGTGNDHVDINDGDGEVGPLVSLQDGRHQISLGDGSDDLVIVGDVDNYDTSVVGDGTTTIDAGADNDTVTITGNGDYSITLGSGDDALRINSHVGGEGDQVIFGNEGDDLISVWAEGETDANLGAGDDVFVKVGDGDDSVIAEGGDDLVVVLGDGDHTVRGNDGDDSVFLGARSGELDDLLHEGIVGGTVVGVHNVDLGAGNDLLVINGSRTDDDNVDNIDNPDAATIVVGGEGNDTVVVTEDHFLDVELNDGDDQLDINAKDLSVDDSLTGGSGIDTLVLQNQDYSEIDGRVLRSETAETTDFEVFDLRDNNITLHVTTEMIETSDLVENGNRKIIVRTENAVEGYDERLLPTLTLISNGTEVAPFFNGMTENQFDAIVLNWRNGLYREATDKTGTAATSTAIANYYDASAGSDLAELAMAREDLQEWLSEQIAGNGYGDAGASAGDGSLVLALDDRYYFVRDIDGAQKVDITDIETQNYRFELDGGIVRDIVVADDDSINSKSVLRFDSDATAANSTQDTLRVMNGAEITAADLRNVSGLERIELMFTASNADEVGVGAEWGITLTEYVINQTTADAPLIIDVADNVPENSKLYITLDASVANADSDVFIEVNSNVTVMVRRVGETEYVEVTEPEFGTDLGPDGGRVIMVRGNVDLEFTAQGDNLYGTDDDDEFVADSLAYIETGDTADGNGGDDTLHLNFTVNNATEDLQDIFEGADIREIEDVVFDTERNVVFGGEDEWGDFDGIGDNDWMAALHYLETGRGDDSLTNMRGDVEYFLNEGDDYISFEDDVDNPSTVDGGNGIDFVQLASGNEDNDQTLYITNVEFVSDDDASEEYWSGGDTVTLLNNHSQSAETEPDTATADPDDTVGAIYFWNVENINGSGESDHVHADSNGGYIDIYGEDGNDTITVGGDTPYWAYVSGGDGSDDIDVHATYYAEVDGNSDDDHIMVVVENDEGDNRAGEYWSYSLVNGGSGDDTIDVEHTHASYWDYSGGYWGGAEATVYGGTGDDQIDLEADVTVDVDAGEDWTEAYYWGQVYGDDGADTIDVDVVVEAVNYGEDDSAGAYSYVSVYGGSDDDVISVRNEGIATVVNGEDDTDAGVEVYTWVNGDDGDDLIYVETRESNSTGEDYDDSWADSTQTGFYDYNSYWGSYTGVSGGDGDDTIGVDSDNATEIFGNDGDDLIVSFSHGNGLYWDWNGGYWYADDEYEQFDRHEITGGAGDDTIVLGAENTMLAAEEAEGPDFVYWDGQDILNFGDIVYQNLQVVGEDSQGTDTIENFQFESYLPGDAAPTDQDGMNFQDFLQTGEDAPIADANITTTTAWTHGTTVDASDEAGNSIVVLSSTVPANLTAADFDIDAAGTIHLNDNARAVVVVGIDGTPSGDNVGNYEIYFVQDVDTGTLGQTWKVDLVATVAGATEVGIESVVDNLLDGLWILADSQTADGVGDQIIETDGFDHDFLYLEVEGLDQDYEGEFVAGGNYNLGSGLFNGDILEILSTGDVNLGGVTADGSEAGSWTGTGGIESLILSTFDGLDDGTYVFSVIAYSDTSNTADAGIYSVEVVISDNDLDSTTEIAVEQVALLVGVGNGALDASNFF